MKVSAKIGWPSELICMFQQRQGDYQTVHMHQYTGRLSEMGASTSKNRETIRAGVHISAKRVVIRAAMHASAMTGKLSEALCMYHQGDVGHQRWCACISKDSEIIRDGVHVSADRKSSCPCQELNPNCS
jgi:hypothetical protein